MTINTKKNLIEKDGVYGKIRAWSGSKRVFLQDDGRMMDYTIFTDDSPEQILTEYERGYVAHLMDKYGDPYVHQYLASAVPYNTIAAAIRTLRDEFLEDNPIKGFYDINNGLCEEFAETIASRLGLDTKTDCSCTDQFWPEEGAWYADPDLIRKAGGQYPESTPEGQLCEVVGSSTHQWITVDGHHFDAECPEGVRNFLELPIFKRQVNALGPIEIAGPQDLDEQLAWYKFHEKEFGSIHDYNPVADYCVLQESDVDKELAHTIRVCAVELKEQLATQELPGFEVFLCEGLQDKELGVYINGSNELPVMGLDSANITHAHKEYDQSLRTAVMGTLIHLYAYSAFEQQGLDFKESIAEDIAQEFLRSNTLDITIPSLTEDLNM